MKVSLGRIGLTCSLILTASVVVGCGNRTPPPEEMDSQFLRLVGEVTKHFQRGTEGVDCDRLKKLIIRCAEADDRMKLATKNGDTLGIDKAREECCKAGEDYFRYLDSHQVKPSDVLEVREWLASSFDGSFGDANPKTCKSLAFRGCSAIMACGSTCGGKLDPKQLLLLSLLGEYGSSLTRAVEYFVLISPGSSEENRKRHLLPTKKFLMSPENNALRNALFDISSSFFPARDANMIGVSLRCVKSINRLALAGKDSATRKEVSDTFMRLSNEALITDRLPAFALWERYQYICYLRDAWNLIHLFGETDEKRSFRSHIESLRDFYSARDDRVTVKWLDEVMQAPEEPAWLNHYLEEQKEPKERSHKDSVRRRKPEEGSE